MWYNAPVDPVMRHKCPEVLLYTDSGAKGAVCHYLSSSGFQYSWVNQTVPFAYL